MTHRSLCAIGTAVSLSFCCATAAAGVAPIVWQFDTDAHGWQPRATSVRVSRLPGERPGSRGRLRIQGRIAQDWNYALSEQRPMVAGRFYRLAAWVRVDTLGTGTPAPYLKCEFVAADRNANLGQVRTDPYDTARMGTWQELSVEFRTPDSVQLFWLALEKGTSDPTEIDACIDEVAVRPIERLSTFERRRATVAAGSGKRDAGLGNGLGADRGSCLPRRGAAMGARLLRLSHVGSGSHRWHGPRHRASVIRPGDRV